MPSQKFTITLSQKGTAYGEKGNIGLDERELRKGVDNPHYFNRGLFHESVHGILEGFAYQAQGQMYVKQNHFPEVLAAILQVETLRSYQSDGACDEAVAIAAEHWGLGYGDVGDDTVHGLWLAYGRHSFNDFRQAINHVGNNPNCLTQATWKADWNKLCKLLNLRIQVP
jgi:hypothetical protein